MREPPVAGLAQTGRRCFSASATAASQPPEASMSGPATRTGRSAAASRAASAVSASGSGAGAPGHAAGQRLAGAVGVGLLVPVVHRDRDEGGPARRQHRVVDGPGHRPGNVLRPRRLVAPLDVGLGADDGVAVGQVGLDRDLRRGPAGPR